MEDKVLETLKLSYEAEKEGLKMYLRLAHKCNVHSGKNMFIQLTADEVDHLELIQKLIEKYLYDKKYEYIEVPKGRLSKILPNANDISLQPSEKAFLTDEEALNIALAFELKSKNFYMEEYKKINEPEVKKLFYDLSEIEEQHYRVIQAELDFIHKVGFWFDTKEFSLEKEP